MIHALTLTLTGMAERLCSERDGGLGHPVYVCYSMLYQDDRMERRIFMIGIHFSPLSLTLLLSLSLSLSLSRSPVHSFFHLWSP